MMTIAAILLTLTAADPLPAGYTCEDVRRVVAEQGKVKAIAWAVRQGLSLRQIYQIRVMCKV